MRSVLVAIATYLCALLLPQHRLALECAALRQQLVVFKREKPRPKLEAADRLFWRLLRQIHFGWADLLVVVKTGDGCFLASRRLSATLAITIETNRGPAYFEQRSPISDPTNEA